jgi:hypothetical protein
MLRPRVTGLDDVMKNLRREVGKVKGRTVAGLLAGGLIIQATAQKKAPRVTGNLAGSAYTRKSPENDKIVEVGFGAAYALFVHENMEQVLKGQPRKHPAKGTYWDNGEPKFLENAAREETGRVVRIVASYAEIKA